MVSGALNSVYNGITAIPRKLNELRSADNLQNIAHFVFARLSLSDLSNDANMYHADVSKKAFFYIEFFRAFRLPHMWLHTVSRDTMIESDDAVTKIMNVLLDANAKTPTLSGVNNLRIANIRELKGELEKHVRESLDTLLESGKGYTTSGFKQALETELSERFTVGNTKVIVNLESLEIINAPNKLEQNPDKYVKTLFLTPFSLTKSLLLAVKTFTCVVTTSSILDEWHLYNTPELAKKFGLEGFFNRNFSGGSVASTLVYICHLAKYILTGVINQVEFSKMREKINPLHGKLQVIVHKDKEYFHIWKTINSIANAVIYTLGLFSIPRQEFFNYIQIVKAVELIGDLTFTYKYRNFSKLQTAKN